MKIHNHKIIVVYDKKITLTFMITLKSMLHKNQTKKLKTPSLFNVFLEGINFLTTVKMGKTGVHWILSLHMP